MSDADVEVAAIACEACRRKKCKVGRRCLSPACAELIMLSAAVRSQVVSAPLAGNVCLSVRRWILTLIFISRPVCIQCRNSPEGCHYPEKTRR